ncbi:aminoacyl-tRNA deacylase [Spirochaeta dissipatitropha]
MKQYEEKLRRYIEDHAIDCRHLSFEQSCHSVEDAAAAAQAEIDSFVKNICMIDSEGNVILAIVKGEDRASTSRVEKALQIGRPRVADPDEILEKTGYPCGGTPSFGFQARFLIDPRVMENDTVFTGGGSANSLVEISTQELQKACQGEIVRVRR